MNSEGLISLFSSFRKRREYQAKEEVGIIFMMASCFQAAVALGKSKTKRLDQSGTRMRPIDLRLLICFGFFIVAFNTYLPTEFLQEGLKF